MSTIDLLTRVNGIIKKYEKYDAERPKEGPAGIASNDHFLKLYRTIEDEVNDVLKVRALHVSDFVVQMQLRDQVSFLEDEERAQTDFPDAFCVESCGGRARKEPGRHSHAQCGGPPCQSCPAAGASQTTQASAQEGT
jgi:hypothetical protein